MIRIFLVKLLSLNILIISIFFITKPTFAAQTSPQGLGFGVCHWPGTYGMARSESTVNWFYWGGGGQDWNKIEAVRGVYDFSEMDKEIAAMFTNKPNASYWLDVLTEMPQTVPEWAKQDQSLGYIERASRASVFPLWNKEFQKVFEALITKTSEHIYSSSFDYRKNLKAVIMMAGGGFGEMITWSNCAPVISAVCKKYLDAGYTDDIYYDALVNWLVPLYIRLFPDYPLVLQIGGGIYGNDTGNRVTQTLVDRYGSRIYIKWNGWNYQYAQKPTNTDKHYHELLTVVSNKARVGFEPGGIVEVPPDTTEETRQKLFDSLMKTLQEVPVSYFCLQDKYYTILTDTQLNELSIRMRGINTAYPTFPPSPTSSPTPSPTPSPTSSLTPSPTTIPGNADVDGNGKVDMLDYYYFTRAVYSGSLPTGIHADVNKDGQINNVDREIIVNALNQ